MKLHRSVKRYLIFLLSFLMAFEPFMINVVRAEEAADARPEVGVEENLDDGFENLDVLKPVEYLEYMLSLRGRSRSDSPDEVEAIESAIAWGEWMNTLSGAYALMDDGSTDVITFYNTLGEINGNLRDTSMYYNCVLWSANKAALAGSFICRVSGLSKLGNKIGRWVRSKESLMKGFDAMGKIFGKAAKKVGAFTHNADIFLKHMCPPVGFRKGCETGEGFVSYWRWVARKTKLENNDGYRNLIKKFNDHVSKENSISTNRGAKVMSDTKGIAHTVGIGLTVVGICFDAYSIHDSIENGEFAKGRRWAYSNVKDNVSLALGVGSLVAMFCVPIVGQVVGALALIWTALTIVGDQIGEHNKKWKDAYRNSYWFLYNEDPEFRSYYENKDLLTEDEKSAAYVITERNYGEDYKEAAREFYRNNDGKNSYYDDKSQEAISSRVYIELEKQGVLTSYYNRSTFRMPDYSSERMLELWEAKADYMSWKPTEEESVRAENRGFWGKIGHAINPMTYVSWVGDKINSKKYNKFSDYNIEKVYFNPDFVLMKKYQNWITSNRKMKAPNEPDNNNDFYRAVGLRIEQAPFNYIPLVTIDSLSWDDNLLVQAFKADAFMVGAKEMEYFANVIESAGESVKEGIKDTADTIEALKDSMKQFKHRAKALQAIRDAYRDFPDSVSDGKDLIDNDDVEDGFGFKWKKEYGTCTPRNIVNYYWTDISQALTFDPLSISQKGAECQLLCDSIKRNLDTAVLMEELSKEKQDALDSVDTDFPNYAFNRFIKEGTYLTVKGDTFADWLSGIHTPYEELRGNTQLYDKRVEEFKEAAEDANKGKKNIIFGLFRKTDDEYHPNNVIKEINSMLNIYQNVVRDFEGITTELGRDGLSITADDELVYTAYQGRDIVAMDPAREINTELIPLGDTED